MAGKSALHGLWLRFLSLFYELPPEDETVETVVDDPPATTQRTAAPEYPAEKPRPIHILRQNRPDYAGMPVVLARPRNMEDATVVADRIKDRVPVIMNLEGVEEAMARRIVDFIGGVVFALDGSLRKSGRAVFVCAPSDIPLEELRATARARPTTLFDNYGEEPQQMAL